VNRGEHASSEHPATALSRSHIAVALASFVSSLLLGTAGIVSFTGTRSPVALGLVTFVGVVVCVAVVVSIVLVVAYPLSKQTAPRVDPVDLPTTPNMAVDGNASQIDELSEAFQLALIKRFPEALAILETLHEERLPHDTITRFLALRERVGNVVAALRRVPAGAHARFAPSGNSSVDHRRLLRCALDEPGGPELVAEILKNISDKSFDAILHGEALERLGKTSDARIAYAKAQSAGEGRNELAARLARKRGEDLHRRTFPGFQEALAAMQPWEARSTVMWNAETRSFDFIDSWTDKLGVDRIEIDDLLEGTALAAPRRPALRLVPKLPETDKGKGEHEP